MEFNLPASAGFLFGEKNMRGLSRRQIGARARNVTAGMAAAFARGAGLPNARARRQAASGGGRSY